MASGKQGVIALLPVAIEMQYARPVISRPACIIVHHIVLGDIRFCRCPGLLRQFRRADILESLIDPLAFRCH